MLEWTPIAVVMEESSSGNSALAGLLMAAGVLIITAVTVLRLWKRRRQREARDATPIAERAGITPRQSTDRMEAVMVEMQELTRLCAAQVENRVARLEMLLREADDRIAHLESLTGGERAEPATPNAKPTVAPIRPAPPPDIGGDELSQRVYALADSGMTPNAVAQELGEHTGKVELILALRNQSLRAKASA